MQEPCLPGLAGACLIAFFSAAPARADAIIPGETGEFEVDYLNFILDHHWSGLRTTELATGSLPDATAAIVPPTVNPYPGSPVSLPPTAGKATNEVVLDIAPMSNMAQRLEIVTGQGFLQDWYGITTTLELPRSGAELIPILPSRTGRPVQHHLPDELLDASHHGAFALA